jgi:hypothetical protein
MSDAANATPEAPQAPGATLMALKLWAQAYRIELVLFVVSYFTLAMFSGQRFLRQSAAPHFVYQSKAWLDGRQDIDPEVLPNFEDWACVRDVGGVKQRCTRPLVMTDKWYSSFPMFPSAVMLPFVAVNGYQLNDTSFGVFIGALAIALFYSVLRMLSEHEGTARKELENAALALILGFGTLFFYASIRGEVWFSAEVMGVALTCAYLRNAVGARKPLWAGIFWSMAVLTRTPLLFTGVFFFIEALAPTPGKRVEELKAFFAKPGELFKTKLQPFLVGAAPLAIIAMAMNQTRFGSIAEFGHRFFFENRVNQDIDTFGLFHPSYLGRNLEAAFLLIPTGGKTLAYSPWGLSLLLTTPVLVLIAARHRTVESVLTAAAIIVGTFIVAKWLVQPTEAMLPATDPRRGTILLDAFKERPEFREFVESAYLKMTIAVALGIGGLIWRYRSASSDQLPRLTAPLWLTVAACALPGFFYQNTGYAQFGFRFSLDYTPYLLLLLAVGGWNLKKPLPVALLTLGVLVNFWGALGFKGYTELVHGW